MRGNKRRTAASVTAGNTPAVNDAILDVVSCISELVFNAVLSRVGPCLLLLCVPVRPTQPDM